MQRLRLATFTEILRSTFEQLEPSRTVLIYREEALSLRQMQQKIGLYRNCLAAAGVSRGSHVVYSLDNSPDSFCLLLGVLELGACAVPMHDRTPAIHKLGILRLCRADFLLTDAPAAAALKAEAGAAPLPCRLITRTASAAADCVLEELQRQSLPEAPVYRAQAEDRLFLLSSSGTTGVPKFAEITQGNVATLIRAAAYLMEPLDDFAAGFSCLMAFPLSTSSILFLLAKLCFGETLVLLDDYAPLNFLKLMQRWQVDAVAASPSYYETLIDLPLLDKYDPTSVKRIYSGMDAFSNSLIGRLRAYFRNVKIVATGYGLVETTTAVLAWRALQEEDYHRPTHIMTPIPGLGNEIKIIPDSEGFAEAEGAGEIVIRGPSVVPRYFNNPQETASHFSGDGWLRTGDIGCRVEGQAIKLLGRKKFIIKRGGRSVSPVEINQVLQQAAGVEEAAVVGVPHPLYGEMIWAFIKQAPAAACESGALMRLCRERLPTFMVPDQISFLQAIPKTPGVGKIDLEELIRRGKAELQKMNGGKHE